MPAPAGGCRRPLQKWSQLTHVFDCARSDLDQSCFLSRRWPWRKPDPAIPRSSPPLPLPRSTSARRKLAGPAWSRRCASVTTGGCATSLVTENTAESAFEPQLVKVLQSARFRPAIDANGQPVESQHRDEGRAAPVHRRRAQAGRGEARSAAHRQGKGAHPQDEAARTSSGNGSSSTTKPTTPPPPSSCRASPSPCTPRCAPRRANTSTRKVWKASAKALEESAERCSESPTGAVLGRRLQDRPRRSRAEVSPVLSPMNRLISRGEAFKLHGIMYALSIRGLTKTYKNGVQALKGVDLDVEQGDFFALLGPNGAGKTTLIGILTSLVNKIGGHGERVRPRHRPRARGGQGLHRHRAAGNQLQPVRDAADHPGRTRPASTASSAPLARERAEKYLSLLQLCGQAQRRWRAACPGGMKRRLMIARALVHEPRLLILDEPTAGVDIEIRRSMWEFLREINARGTTIILTTHYLEEAETLCRNIAIINGGLIAERDRMSTLLRKLQAETFVLEPARSRAQRCRRCRATSSSSSTTTRSRSRCPRSRASTKSSRSSSTQGIGVLSHAQQGEPARRAVHEAGRAQARRRGAMRHERRVPRKSPPPTPPGRCGRRAGSASRPSSSASTAASSASGRRPSCRRRSPRRCTSSSSVV